MKKDDENVKEDKETLELKKLVGISDELKRKSVQKEVLSKLRGSVLQFQEAFAPRRQRLLEINAIYRNKSYLDVNKVDWQTKTFFPYPFKAVEDKTSMVHQALWGNKYASPFTAIGKTPEDQAYADSAETVLNNTSQKIGLYGISENGIRTTVKYGMGVYNYGWVRRNTKRLWKQVKTDAQGKVIRDPKTNRPRYEYVRKNYRINQPYVRSIDIIDNFGWDPSATSFAPWSCGWIYEIRSETKEELYEKEVTGLYDKGSYDKLTLLDPHGLNSFGDTALHDEKLPQIRQDEGMVETPFRPMCDTYRVIDWYGWLDIDGDGLREFVKITAILENGLILSAEENLQFEYPFVDIHFTRSLHSMTSWGVVDPVVEMTYGINEFANQRGDAVKLKLNPQFMINEDMILPDHAYVSYPGAFHPFAAGEEDVQKAMRVVQFQNLEFLSNDEQERLVNVFREVTGSTNIQQAVTNVDRTPATTLLSLLNQQQATDQMIVNGILERHAVLGSRLLKQIQLFGDEEFIVRSAGRNGLEFRKESIQNILGDFDIQITTSSFFGNKQVETQQLIQLRPIWAQGAPHIDLAEVDKLLIEGIAPKRLDKIVKIPPEPLKAADEIELFVYGQGESVQISPMEDLGALRVKQKALLKFQKSEVFKALDSLTKDEFERHMEQIQVAIDQATAQMQIQAQQAAKIQGGLQQGDASNGPQGNLGNLGNPNMRTIANQVRPNVPR